ncbi:hypothetical protein chiPu_0014365 [Chiloscyllium punctatum]|uniref:Uncharacterized protein n=1 Tax=Chiloscyllium punctatum TaxID=137246 RepID=A0A401SZQ6_CHIPU|nr:hypothetical protein [Chiloscyllium punctatum]
MTRAEFGQRLESLMGKKGTVESKIRERIAQQDNSNEETFNLEESTKTVWDKQVTVHVILRNFALFMESTIRAIRFMQSAPATAL